ncbi:MAG: DUF4307 domain-containing protein [Streptosporangiales bacterium]|nr:DUF4307 domain-containing protein [Streptosporangiales bacterium]
MPASPPPDTGPAPAGDPATARTAEPSRRSRLGLVVIGVIAAVLATGWASVIVFYNGDPTTRGEIISWRTESDSAVSVTFQVGRTDRTQPAVCVLQATDAQHVEVGRAEVRVPPGRERVTHRLATTARTASADVTGCRTAS